MRGRKPSKKRDFKRANGSGSIKKLSGNRRKPYAVIITKECRFDKESGNAKQVRQYLDYYPTKEAAEHALNEYLRNPYDIDAERITFKDVYEKWSERYYPTLSNKSSERTCISAFNHSEPLWNQQFKTITIATLEDTINECSGSASIKGRMKSLYNLMYDYAVKAEIVQINIARNFAIKNIQKSIKIERKTKLPISDEHIKLLFKYINTNYYIRLILIGLYTGFRPRELCMLEKDNIHLDDNYIIGGMKTDAGTDRYVPIHPDIKQYIEYYLERSSSKYLIDAIECENKMLTYDKYNGRFKKIMSQMGADGLYSPHCTRHTFITKAKEVGMDEYAIKKIVGHEISDITEAVYTHRGKDFLQSEMQKFKLL